MSIPTPEPRRFVRSAPRPTACVEPSAAGVVGRWPACSGPAATHAPTLPVRPVHWPPPFTRSPGRHPSGSFAFLVHRVVADRHWPAV